MFVTLMNYNVVHKSEAIQQAIIDGYHVATFVLREAVRKKIVDFEDIVLIICIQTLPTPTHLQ